jgi:hypothetical protein
MSSAELFILKAKFGMSLAALVYRLHDLGVLRNRYYQDWWRHINKMGWRKTEPEETPAEGSHWLMQSTLRAVSEGLITEEQAESLLGRPLPRAEGPSWRRALAALPKEKRAAALAKQAATAAGFYASESVDSDDEIVEY